MIFLYHSTLKFVDYMINTLNSYIILQGLDPHPIA